jgi:xanthine dehydrogenase YagT iron-sulfur-binding subunit
MPDHDSKTKASPTGHSRRDFLRGSGLAAASAVLTTTAVEALDEAKAAEAAPKVLKGDVPLTLKVNGNSMSCTVEPRSTLLDTLRNRLDVTGPKAGLRSRQLRRLHGDP